MLRTHMCLTHHMHQGETVFAHPTLESLDISFCEFQRVALRCKSLTALQITTTSLTAISAAALPALASLVVTGCHGLPDASLRAALTQLTALSRLELGGGTAASDETLRAAAGALPALAEVALTGCGAAVAFNAFNVSSAFAWQCPLERAPGWSLWLSIVFIPGGFLSLTRLVLTHPHLKPTGLPCCDAPHAQQLRRHRRRAAGDCTGGLPAAGGTDPPGLRAAAQPERHATEAQGGFVRCVCSCVLLRSAVGCLAMRTFGIYALPATTHCPAATLTLPTLERHPPHTTPRSLPSSKAAVRCALSTSVRARCRTCRSSRRPRGCLRRRL